MLDPLKICIQYLQKPFPMANKPNQKWESQNLSLRTKYKLFYHIYYESHYAMTCTKFQFCDSIWSIKLCSRVQVTNQLLAM
jgi:hypothetical protein